MSEKFNVTEFDGIDSMSGGPDDIFVTSASFEFRSTSTTRALSEDYSADHGIIYVNREILSEESKSVTQQNLELIENRLEKYCSNIHIAKGSRLDQGVQLRAIKDTFDQCFSEDGDQSDITLDCTTFTRESLLTALSVIYNRKPRADTRVTYVSPEEHGSWLSRGYDSIRNILGFTGLHDPSKPTLLVVLTGFETHRTTKVIEEFEPSKLLLGVGDPPTKTEFLDRNQQEQKIVRDRQEYEGFEFPADSIEGTYGTLSRIINENIDKYNVVIAPMSTKLSTIGAWEAARSHEQVQMTYSIPDEYNEDGYSVGEDQIYIDYLNV